MKKRWKPGVTVAAIIERDGRYLLVEEARPEGLMLNNPAGHLEPAESPEQGVVREAMEETAHPFTPTDLVGIYLSSSLKPIAPGSTETEEVTYLRFAYAGTVGEPEAGRALDEGIVRALWMTPDEIRASQARHRSPMVLRCIEDHIAGRRFPLDVVHTDPAHMGVGVP
ncbi:NUDIX hydrolase [soil metagenome]